MGPPSGCYIETKQNLCVEVSKPEIKGEKSAPKDHQKAEANSNVETKNTAVGSNTSDKKTNSKKDIKCENLVKIRFRNTKDMNANENTKYKIEFAFK